MVDITKAEKLAKLKAEMKTLETEMRRIQKEMIEEGAPDKIKTSHGTLSLASRKTISCTDKKEAFKVMGEEMYLAASTLSFASVKKIAGEFRAEMFEKSGIFMQTAESWFYTLRK